MSDAPTTSPTSALLSGEAHALRNHLATIRSAAQLVDDPELAAALGEAASAVQVATERAVVSARVELGERPAPIDIDLVDLVRLAARRTTREGRAAPTEPAASEANVPLVHVPGSWAERLVADLLHLAPIEPAPVEIAVRDGRVELRCAIDLERAGLLDVYLAHVAAGCGCELELRDGHALVRFPTN